MNRLALVGKTCVQINPYALIAIRTMALYLATRAFIYLEMFITSWVHANVTNNTIVTLPEDELIVFLPPLAMWLIAATSLWYLAPCFAKKMAPGIKSSHAPKHFAPAEVLPILLALLGIGIMSWALPNLLGMFSVMLARHSFDEFYKSYELAKIITLGLQCLIGLALVMARHTITNKIHASE